MLQNQAPQSMCGGEVDRGKALYGEEEKAIAAAAAFRGVGGRRREEIAL